MARTKGPSKNRTRNPNGMGNIYKTKSGRYEWKQMIDGEVRVLSSKEYSALQEKIKKVADLPIIKDKQKVSDWFEKWLKNVESLKKSATYNQYLGLYTEHIKPVIGKRKMSTIKQYDIQNVITEMCNKTRFKRVKSKKTGKIEKVDTGIKLSTWTMKHTKKVMSIAFTKAFEDKLIPENPVKNIEIPKRQKKSLKTLKTAELSVLFKHLKDTRWYWAFRFMLVTGLRRGELLALKWSDIDYKNRQVVVDESDSSSGVGDTKNSKVHYAPLSDLSIFYLGKQKEMLENETNPILHNKDLKASDIVFPSIEGTVLKPDSLNSVLDRINKKANIHVTPHMLRHTFVYMNKGILSLSELQEALGHDESTTTLDLYGTMLSDTGKVSKKVDDAFKDLDTELEKIEEKKDGKVVPFRKVK